MDVFDPDGHRFQVQAFGPSSETRCLYRTEVKMALVDGFSHLVIQVTELDRSEEFYQEILGLDPVGRDLVSEEGPNSLLKEFL